MVPYTLTPAAGKRLIAKAVVELASIKSALQSGTIVVIAGTTNGYVAQELLQQLSSPEDLDTHHFFRGIVLPPNYKTKESGRLTDESLFPGDVVIEKGVWQKGKTIFDTVDDLKKGDLILKGANCINMNTNKAGILIGHPKGGTIVATLQAVVGRRVELLLPVGLEKRVHDDIDVLAERLNAAGSKGPRLLSVSGKIITEIQAVNILSGAHAHLVAAGGVCGAEGAVWLGIDGEEEAVEKAKNILDTVSEEPPFLI